MEALKAKLQQLFRRVDLPNRYKTPFTPDDGPFSDYEKELLKERTTDYEKTLILRSISKEKYGKNDPSETNLLDFWIINTWGGISSFKNNHKNREKLKRFREELDKGYVTKNSFQVISSLSKVAAFMNPDRFQIYDSRAIYALNWLLMTNENVSELKVKYFPLPSGRNSNLNNTT